jgi:integrase/recombinase XerD
MTISDAREHYLRWLLATKDFSQHTLRAYASDIASLQRHLGETATTKQITSTALIAFLEGQLAAGLSPISVKRRASGLRGFCTWLVVSGLLEADPWKDVRITLGRTRRLPRVVSSDELQRLLWHLQQRAGVPTESSPRRLRKPNESTTLLAVALMVATGLRVGELVGLDCRDIDLAARTLRLLGKGRRERQVFLTNEWISDLTASYLDLRSKLRLSHSRLLFNRRGAPLTTAGVRAGVHGAARAPRLSVPLTPHMLRHTAATQLIEAGVDIRFIQRLLGHASLTTTELYTHVSDRALRLAVSDAQVLERLLKGG